MKDQYYYNSTEAVELKEGLSIIELEERLETVQVAAAAASSERCDVNDLL